jgi:hypothetical protein
VAGAVPNPRTTYLPTTISLRLAAIHPPLSRATTVSRYVPGVGAGESRRTAT